MRKPRPSESVAGTTTHRSVQDAPRAAVAPILVATTEHGLSAILFGDNDDALVSDLTHEFPQAALSPANENQRAVIEKGALLIDQPAASFDLPLDITAPISSAASGMRLAR